MRSTNTQSRLKPGSLLHITLVVILSCLEVYGQQGKESRWLILTIIEMANLPY